MIISFANFLFTSTPNDDNRIILFVLVYRYYKFAYHLGLSVPILSQCKCSPKTKKREHNSANHKRPCQIEHVLNPVFKSLSSLLTLLSVPFSSLLLTLSLFVVAPRAPCVPGYANVLQCQENAYEKKTIWKLECSTRN